MAFLQSKPDKQKIKKFLKLSTFILIPLLLLLTTQYHPTFTLPHFNIEITLYPPQIFKLTQGWFDFFKPKTHSRRSKYQFTHTNHNTYPEYPCISCKVVLDESTLSQKKNGRKCKFSFCKKVFLIFNFFASLFSIFFFLIRGISNEDPSWPWDEPSNIVVTFSIFFHF